MSITKKQPLKQTKLKSVSSYLSTVKDHRMVNKCKHKLSDILFIGLLTHLSNGDDFVDMVLFGKTHKTFLQKYITLTNGIPSEDTFERVFSAIERHYLLALKTNQRELYDDVECGFKACKPINISENWEYAHGRYETRKCSILSADGALLPENLSQWCGLKTIIKVDATRLIRGKETSETRFYISDEQGKTAEYYNALVRGHWSIVRRCSLTIENQLHWHLDVTFTCAERSRSKEDASRTRKGNAPENLATIRKLALQIITAQNDKLSLKKRRVMAAYDQEYMRKLLE